MTQLGVGSSPGYSALDDRRQLFGPVQEGVGGTSDAFMVVQRGAGANLSVDVTMPAAGWAKVQGDSVANQGLYTVPVHSATVNQTLTTANASNPRIDQIVLRVYDTTHDGSGLNEAQIDVLTGTPTGGATLTNRNGVAALPGSALLLADVLVPASDTTITNDQIRDRRKWALGAFNRIAYTGGNKATTSATRVEIDATNLKPRLECSGAPVRVRLQGFASDSTSANVAFGVNVDGAAPDSTGDILQATFASGNNNLVVMEYVMVPAPGSHQFAPTFSTTSGTLTVAAVAAAPLQWTVEEIVRPNTANNTTTTG